MEDEELYSNLFEGCDYCELRNTGCGWCRETAEIENKMLEEIDNDE